MKKIPHPIQYQGSKRNLAPVILRYVPQNVDCLIEPFADSAAISIVATYEKLKAKAHLLEKEIPSFVKEIIEKEIRRKST